MKKLIAILAGLLVAAVLSLVGGSATVTTANADYDTSYCTTDPLAEPDEDPCIGTPRPVADPTCSPVPIPQMCPDHKNPSPPWPTDAQQRATLAFLHNCIFTPPAVRTSYTPWAVVVTWGNGNTQWRKLPWAVLELYKDHWRSEANERFPDAYVGAWCGAAAH